MALNLITNDGQSIAMKRLSLSVLLAATFLLVTSPLITNDAFATHLSNELKWQMVFISSQPACSNYHYQMMNTYYDIAVQYMGLYKVENSSYKPLCISEEKYSSDYQSPHDLDLIIFVYDKDLGQKELHENKMGGVYSHSGIDRTHNHAIIICDCPNFYYSTPVWILSHELSHFILYYKDYEMDVIERMIHVNDAKYDQCLKQYSSECKSVSTKMKAGPGGYAYSVMPVYEPAIGEKSETKIIGENGSLVLTDISKLITKWWATEKISDGDYSNAIGLLVDSDVLSSQENFEIILTDGPLDDSVTWKEKMEEIAPQYLGSVQTIEDNSNEVLSRVPSNLIASDKDFMTTQVTVGLPEWFKETAAWWGQEKITDKEFKKNVEYLLKEGIIRTHTSDVFQELIAEREAQTTSQNPDTEIGSDESLTQELPLTSNESPVVNEKNYTVDTKGIQGLVDFVNSVMDSGDLKEKDGTRLMKNLDSAIIAFDVGKTSNGCNNIENFFTIVNYLMDKNKIEQSLGKTLIDAGETVKIDSCKIN